MVGEGKVGEGRRRKEKVRKGKGRQEKVKEYRRWKGTYRTNKDDRGKDGQSKVNFDGKGSTSRQNKAKENGYGCKGIWEVGRVEKSKDWMDLKRIFYVHQSDEEISSKKGGILDIVRSNFRNLQWIKVADLDFRPDIKKTFWDSFYSIQNFETLVLHKRQTQLSSICLFKYFHNEFSLTKMAKSKNVLLLQIQVKNLEIT